MFSTSIKSGWTRSFFCFLFFTLLSLAAEAQVIQNGRMEIPINNDIEAYAAVSLDTMGIVLYRGYIGKDENQLELIRLDTTLQQVWKGFLPVPKGFSLLSAKAADNKIYFF